MMWAAADFERAEQLHRQRYRTATARPLRPQVRASRMQASRWKRRRWVQRLAKSARGRQS